MTATMPPRTATRFRGVIYGWDVIDHHTGEVVKNDYVGQTRQRGRARENQHRDEQPWSDMVKGSPRVLWEGNCTSAELNEQERLFIQDVEVRPRLNWKLNEDNPHHIPKWVQVEQRHARDDAEGRPRWVPPEQRRRESLLEWDAKSPPPASPPRWRPSAWPPQAQKPVLWLLGWVLTVVVAWEYLARYGHFTTRVNGSASAVIAAVLLGWAIIRKPDSWRLWRGRARRFSRFVRRTLRSKR